MFLVLLCTAPFYQFLCQFLCYGALEVVVILLLLLLLMHLIKLDNIVTSQTPQMLHFNVVCVRQFTHKIHNNATAKLPVTTERSTHLFKELIIIIIIIIISGLHH